MNTTRKRVLINARLDAMRFVGARFFRSFVALGCADRRAAPPLRGKTNRPVSHIVFKLACYFEAIEQNFGSTVDCVVLESFHPSR